MKEPGASHAIAIAQADTQPGRPEPRPRSAYAEMRRITTRWRDNDAYGHVNNVVYYEWFDSAVNALLIEHGVLDVTHGEVVGFVVQTHCNYFRPLAFPQPVEIGIRVAHVGRSSVRYELGVFEEAATEPSAQGHFVHVYVTRAGRKSVPLPDALRALVQSLRGSV